LRTYHFFTLHSTVWRGK